MSLLFEDGEMGRQGEAATWFIVRVSVSPCHPVSASPVSRSFASSILLLRRYLWPNLRLRPLRSLRCDFWNRSHLRCNLRNGFNLRGDLGYWSNFRCDFWNWSNFRRHLRNRLLVFAGCNFRYRPCFRSNFRNGSYLRGNLRYRSRLRTNLRCDLRLNLR